MSWVAGLFTGIQGWLYAGIAVILASLIGLFVWRGYEIDNLTKQLQAAQNQAKAAQEQIQVITSVHNQELANQQKANQRADQIRNTPAKDDGAVAPVLLNSLSRL